MWYRLYDGMDETVGPLLAGRLGGRAQKIALSLRLRDPHGNIDVGDAALVRLAVDEVRDPTNPAIVLQEHIVSGVQALFNALVDAFGEGDQLRATQSLENFFDFRRGRLSLAECSAEWTMRLEEAITHAGLDINAVARTFLYFRGSQLPQRHVDDILMQIHGDLSRFQEARTLALRLAHRQNVDNQANFEQTEHHYIGEADDWSWSDESWMDQSAWYAGEWPDYEEYYDAYDGDEYYDIAESWPEEYTTEGNEANSTPNDQTEDAPDQNTYYKKNIGLGCTICGSKWHESGVCPMSSTNYGKGKGKSKFGSFGKGKGKHWKGKGKGKGKKGFRPWRPRFSGKGKGYGRSYYDDFENEADGGYWSNDYFISGQERALLQLHHARTGLQVDMEQKTSVGNPIRTTSNPPTKKPYDEVFSFGKKITAAASSSEEKNETSAKVNKTLSFPVIHEQSTVYHQVRGQKRRGLLVDPGAGAGIVGSETLRDILENIPYLKDRPEVIEWTSRSTSVTGISGQGDSTLAHVTFPFHLTKDLLGSFSADVLGNEGSLCPALLPNPSLRRLHAGVLTEWFENGDGLLVFGEPSEVGDSSRVITLRILLTETGHYILPVDQQPNEIVEEAQTKVIMFMTSVCQQSTSIWNDVHEKNVKLYCNKSLSGTSLVEPEQGERHALPEQDPKKKENKDHWKLDEQQGTLTRVHVRPRLNLFVPQDDHCPVSTASLKLTRTTTATFADGSSSIKQDEWQQEDRHTQLHDRWTGTTVFQLGEETQHHYIHDSKDTMFNEDDLEDYSGDYFPDHLSSKERHYLHKRYAAIPEMFYTRTRRKVIRPSNVKQWLEKQRSKRTFHFWELCSGSGRLTLVALLSGLSVLFPVDLRYGWDIGHPPHQRLLQEVHSSLQPDVITMAPNCRPWSISANRRDPQQTAMEREEERPCLKHLEKTAKAQEQSGKGFLFEQPWSSALWKEIDLPGRCTRTDQCRYGAADEDGCPILKPTGFQSNFELRYSSGLCRGHGGQRHAWLQGQQQGVNRTALAAVYPERLCRSIIKDIKLFLDRQTNLHVSLIENIYYECPKCKMGRSAPKGEEHTYVPGECRYGRWPEGERPTIKQKMEATDPDRGKTPGQRFRDDAARNTRIRETKLSTIGSLPLNEEHSQVLKHALYVFVVQAVKYMEDHDGIYYHWLEDQVILQWLKSIFSPIMNVRGVCAHVQPWTKPTPTPTIRIESGYLRLMMRGDIKNWKMLPPEDLRELSNAQWHEPLELDDDWLIAFFGTDPSDNGQAASSKPPSKGKSSVDRLEELLEESPQPFEPDNILGDLDYTPTTDEEGAQAKDEVPETPLEEEEDLVPAEKQVIKPTYDFRRVYKKLPLLAVKDEAAAKRLLLGLHERMWHSPIMDFRNILIRCGMPPEVIRLAADAISSCTVCRKFVRATRRPKVRTGLAGNFNEVIQVDIFYFKGDMFLLIVDEATRYKSGGMLESRELSSILSSMINNWLKFFGPPRQIVADQESSLMTQEAGAEMDRLGISRRPKGTTSGKEGKKHTGTGLVEKHIDLTKNCMNKIREEAQRYSISVEKEELLSESLMAQNSTLNYGGYTPAMCVFGILPRGFMNVDEISLDVEGSDPTTSTFERAARLRQISLSAAQSAIIEDRIVRAGRTRPQHVDTTSMVPGTTQVEIFREDPANTGHGWRGPAKLLEIDEDNGTVIVKFQGRPYLMSIRHIRPFRGHFFLLDEHTQQEEAMRRLQQLAEQCTPYRYHGVGKIFKKNSITGLFEWHQFPEDLDFTENSTIRDIRLVSQHFSMHQCHGVRYGRAVKTIYVPLHTKGILLSWPAGSKEYVLTEHLTDQHISLKKDVGKMLDNICFIYLYYYVFLEGSDTPVTSSSRQPPSQTMPMDLQEPRSDPVKRDGPETRTVVIGPENKKQRIQLVESMEELHLHSLWWMLQRPLQVNWDPLSFFEQYVPHDFYDNSNTDLLHGRRDRNMISQHSRSHEANQHISMLFQIPCNTSAVLHVDLREGEVFRVEQDTDVLTEAELQSHWHDFEVSDESELRQFVEEKAFAKIHVSKVTDQMVVVDCTWVRKYKKMPDGSRKAKSRLCARGFLDPQRFEVPTRSTTATRLSQRLVLSMATLHGMTAESWDISGAFLKGFSFEKVRELLMKKGIQAPERQVAVVPPANVWRHLAKADPSFAIRDDELQSWLLLCVKPIYGLNDAPLAWQLNIHDHLTSQGGIQSVLDENLFVWKGPQGLKALITTHVDDLAVCSDKKFLTEQYQNMTKKYGKVSLQKLPFAHCGSKYSATPTGLRMDQTEFCMNLKEVKIENDQDDERDLTREEQTVLRSQLGGLLWLAATRLDLVADIGVLQSYVTKSKVKHLKAANLVVRKAQDPRFRNLGLVYQKFSPQSRWRLACIHDASAPSKQRDYAQEGVLVLLVEDRLHQAEDYEIDGDKIPEENFGGKAHVLWSQGSRSKRISYSTSHGETLAAINGMESASLVALRVSELLLPDGKPSLQQLAALQEGGHADLPIDHYTDCRDLYELVTGAKSLPQDKAQRIYTLALKEARLCGRIRWFILIPTQCMTADPLTKPMFSAPILHLLSSGVVRFFNEGKHIICGRRLPKIEIADDTNLEYEDDKVVQALALTMPALFPKNKAAMFAVLCAFLLPGASSSSTTSGSGTCEMSSAVCEMQGWSSEAVLVLLVVSGFFNFVLSFVFWRCCCFYSKKSEPAPKTSKTLMPTDVPKSSEYEEVSLLQLVKTQSREMSSKDREIQRLERELKFKDEEIQRIYHESHSHDVVITSEGTKWHMTSSCRSVKISNAHKTIQACKHCIVQNKPR